MNDIPRRGPLAGGSMYEPLLTSGMIDYAATYHGDTEVVGREIDDSITRSNWREVRANAARLANALSARGYDENARAASLCWNTIDHLALFHGVLGLGIPLHTLNPRLAVHDLAYMADLVEDDICFFDAGNIELAVALAPEAATIRCWVYFGEAVPEECRAMPGIMTVAQFLGDAPDDIVWPSFEETRAATLCFTSGTTGRPKGVAYSHRALTFISFAMSMADMYGDARNGEAVTVLPIAGMYHSNGWMMPFTAPMNGHKLVLPGRRLDAEAVVDLVLAEDVTLAGGVPTVWLDFVSEIERRGVQQCSLRTALVAGTSLPGSLYDKLIAFGIVPHQTWGMTEVPGACRATVPAGTLERGEEALRDLAINRQGRVAMHSVLRIVDDQGAALPHDGQTSGFLQVRGNMVCGRYLGEPGEPREWLDTGDIAVIYPDSSMKLVDRAKDAIKSGGEWISSPELEASAVSHAAVREAAAIGIPDPRWQERPLLICVAEPGAARPGDDDLRSHMLGSVAKWWLPERIEWAEALPRTTTGKVDKRALRELYKADG